MEVNSRSLDMIRSLSRKRKKTEILDEIGLRRKNSITVSQSDQFCSCRRTAPIMNSVSIETAPGEIIFVSSNGHGLGLFKRKNNVAQRPVR